jgi:putative tricarboxylic transport membrane protein
MHIGRPVAAALRRRGMVSIRKETTVRSKCNVVVLAAAAVLSSMAAFAAEYPSKTIEFVIAGNAGGGLDLVGRELESALRDAKLLKEAFVIKNIGGAGGNMAKSHVHQRKGDSHTLYLESNRVYLNKIVGTTNLTYTDVTPVARVMTEYLAWGVRADSPYKSAKDILEKAKADPASVVFGVGTVPGNDQMNILRAAMAYGIDARRVKVLAFKSSRDATVQVLGGHSPVVSSGVSELLEHVKAGKMRLVAVSSPQPLPGELAGVPTWRSMGVDIAILHWRGLFGPPGMPAEAVRYWEQTVQRAMKSDAWKKSLERHLWFEAYADSATFRRDLADENKIYTEVLTQLGMAKGYEQK